MKYRLLPPGPVSSTPPSGLTQISIGLGGEVIAIIGIGGGIGVDGLAGLAEALQRAADRLQIGLAGADKGIEIEHDRLDARIGRGASMARMMSRVCTWPPMLRPLASSSGLDSAA